MIVRYAVMELAFTVRGIQLGCITGPAMFSVGRLDPATRLLIESTQMTPPCKVLDFGCAWGALSLALAKIYPTCVFEGTDINLDAIKLAKINAKRNNISNCTFYESNVYEKVNGNYDVIVCNPPQKAGKEMNKQIITKSIGHLNLNGSLWIVGRHNVGGKTMMGWMQETFGNAESAGKQGVFRVYRSVKIN